MFDDYVIASRISSHSKYLVGNILFDIFKFETLRNEEVRRKRFSLNKRERFMV